MPTIRLIPSSYSTSHSSYATVYNGENNMYNNTDNTSNYASLRGRNQNSTTAYYIFIKGFNFNDLPAGAQVTSFSIKIRCYRNQRQRTGVNYRPRLASSNDINNVISNTTLNSDITQSSAVYTFPNGDLTWNTLSGYGSNFSIVIPLASTSSSRPYVYVYGAEINVTYTLGTAYNINASSSVTGVTVSPISQNIYEGNNATVRIDPGDASFIVTDNGTDVTSQLVEHALTTGEYSIATRGSYGFALNNGYYVSQNKGTDKSCAVCRISFDLPVTSTITFNYINYAEETYDFGVFGNVDVALTTSYYPAGNNGATISETSYKLACNNSTYNKSSVQTLTYSNVSAGEHFIDVKYSKDDASADNNDTLQFQVTITYNQSVGSYYTYTINNVRATHTILIEEDEDEPIVPPHEDPNYTYWPITISSINATTNPENGTVRVVEGSNQTIIISPTDPQLTLALDNGIDITSQLQGGAPDNTYTVTSKVSGAGYGFNLNSSTGYYTSTNNGVASSAAVCRVNFDFETAAVVTIQYINYAQAGYDYGIFGRVDTALGTTNTADTNPYLSCATSTYNMSTAQTLTYEIPSGTHYIDIKYRKNSSTNSNNDNLQWKITSIEATGVSSDYTYTLTNVSRKHSLIFIFGNVTFYYINSSSTSGAKLFPDGQMVKLAGDSYKLVIVPDNVNSAVTVTDNGTNVTSSLSQVTGTDDGTPFVNYVYQLNNIQAAHNLIVQIGTAVIRLYVKENGSWVSYSKAYKKINGSWVEQDITGVFSKDALYVKKS